MAPDPPVLSQSESKIWLDYELRVYDQSINSGAFSGHNNRSGGHEKTQFGGSGDNAESKYLSSEEIFMQARSATLV